MKDTGWRELLIRSWFIMAPIISDVISGVFDGWLWYGLIGGHMPHRCEKHGCNYVIREL